MHRPGAAEGEQREAARIDAALDRDDAQRPHHLLVRHPYDPLGGLQLVEAERGREVGDRGPGRLGVERDAAGQGRVGCEPAEQQVGVGDGGLGAAAPVAGGAGVGAGRARADPQRPARVSPADRAAAGTDRVNVDHRQLDDAAADPPRVGPPHLPVLDHADVARGAAHVEAEGVAVAAGAGQQRGADRAAGRAGEDAPGAGPRRLGGARRRRRRTASQPVSGSPAAAAASPSRPR